MGVAHGFLIVALSILTIDAGYLFEGVGIPLGRFEFGSGTLTRPVPAGSGRRRRPRIRASPCVWPFRENRFRGTFLARLPMPLPEHYLLGFDEQKIEAEGFPNRFQRARQALGEGDLELARTRGRVGRPERRRILGLPQRRAAEYGLVVLLHLHACSTRCPRGPGCWSSAPVGLLLFRTTDARSSGPTRSASGRFPRSSSSR